VLMSRPRIEKVVLRCCLRPFMAMFSLHPCCWTMELRLKQQACTDKRRFTRWEMSVYVEEKCILSTSYHHATISRLFCVVLTCHSWNPILSPKAALHGQAAIASLLIERGASIKPVDTFGETPLALALFSKSYSVSNILRRADGEDVADHRNHDKSWRPRSKGELIMTKFKASNYMITEQNKKKHNKHKKKGRSKSPHRESLSP
jgi:hypothetical protein